MPFMIGMSMSMRIRSKCFPEQWTSTASFPFPTTWFSMPRFSNSLWWILWLIMLSSTTSAVILVAAFVFFNIVSLLGLFRTHKLLFLHTQQPVWEACVNLRQEKRDLYIHREKRNQYIFSIMSQRGYSYEWENLQPWEFKLLPHYELENHWLIVIPCKKMNWIAVNLRKN